MLLGSVGESTIFTTFVQNKEKHVNCDGQVTVTVSGHYALAA